MTNMRTAMLKRGRLLWLTLALVGTFCASTALAAPLPGGTLNPLSIPKYVQPLVIPPVMPATGVATNQANWQPAAVDAAGNPVTPPAADYNISVRQFKQQILPGGQWNFVTGRSDAFPPTPIWSYGPSDLPMVSTAPITYDPVTGLPNNAAALGTNDLISPLPLATTPAAYFNYPAFTMENQSQVGISVRWINELIDNPTSRLYLTHLLNQDATGAIRMDAAGNPIGPVDQTLHWSNPPSSNTPGNECIDAGLTKDCRTLNPYSYTGPVPIVTHVHGAHVNSQSDGYPEAWWLPAASNIPATFAKIGTVYMQNDGTQTDLNQTNDFDPVDGAAFYYYENTQPAATIWYHDHSLGITRLNVYAGPAGFWLIRGGNAPVANHDQPTDGVSGAVATLPGPAPIAGQDPNFGASRTAIREIPIAIQDRSFNADGTLYYPESRAFFDGFNGPYAGLNIDAAGNYVADPASPSDIAPIWNPEAFFNTMVVNGTTWPTFDVAPEPYRFRLLNGCNSRSLNLAMFEVIQNPLVSRIDAALQRLIARIQAISPQRAAQLAARLTAAQNQRAVRYGQEIPFFQIGADQGFLPNVVKITTGFSETLAGNGNPGTPVPLPDPMQALLMMNAERADVIVDFSGLPDGTVIRMINTAPDAPFGGFPDIAADPSTSGQVMQFVVNSAAVPASPNVATSPYNLVMNSEPAIPAANVSQTRPLSLNEGESEQVCVTVGPTGALTTVATFPALNPNIVADCAAQNAVPQAPKEALLGAITFDPNNAGAAAANPALWKDPITETPVLNSTEDWEFYNTTVDAHPIHVHLVRYNVINREVFDPASPTFALSGVVVPAPDTEAGYKDTVQAYPGEVTRVRATFNLPGLYVWHCHIVEHEDNEMMRSFFVQSAAGQALSEAASSGKDANPATGEPGVSPLAFP